MKTETNQTDTIKDITHLVIDRDRCYNFMRYLPVNKEQLYIFDGSCNIREALVMPLIVRKTIDIIYGIRDAHIVHMCTLFDKTQITDNILSSRYTHQYDFVDARICITGEEIKVGCKMHDTIYHNLPANYICDVTDMSVAEDKQNYVYLTVEDKYKQDIINIDREQYDNLSEEYIAMLSYFYTTKRRMTYIASHNKIYFDTNLFDTRDIMHNILLITHRYKLTRVYNPMIATRHPIFAIYRISERLDIKQEVVNNIPMLVNKS